ncbi:MAG: outer membrane lipoprotein carrier protein LolA [Planctomycetes bacterium]|nr:outer membrane lipoprotein carrier protein LolA [Planctomycetota bacterium]
MRALFALLAITLLATLCVAQEAAPGEPPKEEPKPAEKEETLGDLLKRIESAHKEHKDFAGIFEQEKYLPLFDDKITSSGRFAFKKPDHVRWEYTKPHESILVVTGETGKKWSKATSRVEDVKLSDDRGLDAVVKQLFTWFKGEFTKLTDDYDVEILARKPSKLKMTPKKDAVKKFIAAIEVQFAANDDQIASVKILEPMQPGDDAQGYTLYTFKDTRLDKGVADSEFQIAK